MSDERSAAVTEEQTAQVSAVIRTGADPRLVAPTSEHKPTPSTPATGQNLATTSSDAPKPQPARTISSSERLTQIFYALRAKGQATSTSNLLDEAVRIWDSIEPSTQAISVRVIFYGLSKSHRWTPREVIVAFAKQYARHHQTWINSEDIPDMDARNSTLEARAGRYVAWINRIGHCSDQVQTAARLDSIDTKPSLSVLARSDRLLPAPSPPPARPPPQPPHAASDTPATQTHESLRVTRTADLQPVRAELKRLQEELADSLQTSKRLREDRDYYREARDKLRDEVERRDGERYHPDKENRDKTTTQLKWENKDLLKRVEGQKKALMTVQSEVEHLRGQKRALEEVMEEMQRAGNAEVQKRKKTVCDVLAVVSAARANWA